MISEKDIEHLIRSNDLESIKKLIESGELDIESRFQYNNSLLIFCLTHILMYKHGDLYKKHFGIIKYLLELNVDIEHKNEFGNTALYIVTTDGEDELTELLLKHGADIYVKNNIGKTPLDVSYDKERLLNLNRYYKMKKIYD